MAQGLTFFTPGEVVHVRHFQREVISGLFPMRVVQHGAEGLLLWSMEGDRFWLPSMPDGREMRQTPLDEWVAAAKPLGSRVAGHSMLSWHPAGADYSIRFFYRQRRFTSWYANLELEAVPWRDAELAGLDTVDWDLDLRIDINRWWRWKDEEEFTERLRTPELYWVQDEVRVRAAGHEVIKLVEAGVFPFDGTWCDFVPSAQWTALGAIEPPAGWDRPRVC